MTRIKYGAGVDAYVEMVIRGPISKHSEQASPGSAMGAVIDALFSEFKNIRDFRFDVNLDVWFSVSPQEHETLASLSERRDKVQARLVRACLILVA